MAEHSNRQRDDLRLFKLYTECEELFDNLNKALLEGKILSLSDTAQLQHCLDTEGCKLSFQKMVEMRLKLLRDRKIVVLVAGEYSAGKSTIVNVLMGGEYLPMGWGKVSKVVCEIQHSNKKQGTLTFADREEKEIISLQEGGANGANWERIRSLIKTDFDKINSREHNIQRIVVEWPIKVLQGFPLASSDDCNDIGPVSDDSNQRFPTDFMDRLNRPYAGSFEGRQQDYDTSQTYRKVPHTDSPSQPISVASQRLQQLKEPTMRSINVASDEAPSSPSVHDHVNAISDSTRAPHSQENVDNDQTIPKQIVDGIDGTTNDISKEESIGEVQEHVVPDDEKLFTFSFVDCPGIHENDDNTFKSSREEMERCCSFFFVMDESRDEGVHEKGIQQFMKDIDESFKARNLDLRTDILLFFANRIDLAYDSESMVIERVLKKVKETWGMVESSQILPFDAREVLMNHQNQSMDFTIAQKIQQHLSKCIWLWLEEQYVWLLNCLKIASCLATYGKPPTAVKTVLAKPLRKTRQVAFDVQSELKSISETKIFKKAWSDLRNVLQSVGTFNDLFWNEKDIEREVGARIGLNRDKHVDWLVLYGTICEIICEKIETKVTLSDTHRNELKSAQEKFRRAITDLFNKQNKQLNSVQDMLPQQQGTLNDRRVNGVLSIIAPLLASLSIRGAHVFLPFYLIAAPAAPVFLLGNAVWEERKYANQESMRGDFLQNRVAFMKKETDKIITNSKKELKDKTDVSKSVLFRYMFKEMDEKRKIHEKTEALIKMTEYLENIEDKSSERAFVDLFIRAATIFYIEEIIDHNISSEDITWDRRAGTRCQIGGAKTNVFKARVNGGQSAAVKEFRFSYTSAEPEKTFGYYECYCLRKLSGSNSDRVVKLLGTNIDKTKSDVILRIVLERYDGSVLDLVRSRLPRDPEERVLEFLHYTRECVQCVRFLHDNGIIHKNIKPSNFMLKTALKKYSRVVISDIGGLKSEDDLMFCKEGPRKGTRAYLAPEITVMNMGHSKASDVYCMGLVIWELWYRELSYENTRIINNTEQFKIPQNKYPRGLLLKCLLKDANKRATLTDLLGLISNGHG